MKGKMKDQLQNFVGLELEVDANGEPEEASKTLQEIKALFSDETRFRFWFPGTIGTRDLRSDRVNLKLEKENNKWIIKRIYIG